MGEQRRARFEDVEKEAAAEEEEEEEGEEKEYFAKSISTTCFEVAAWR